MENAADALKIAFACFVFVIALSIVFSLMTKVKHTADTVLYYSDKTNYWETTTGDLSEGRIVGEETVIAALYNTGKDQTNITIQKGTTTIYPSSTGKSIQNIIKDELSDKAMYKERIVEITTEGIYRIADDGTKLTETPGKTKVYIIFQKIKQEGKIWQKQ